MDIGALLGSWFSHKQAIEVVCSLNGGDQRIMDEDMIAQKDSSDRLWVPPPLTVEVVLNHRGWF